MAAYQYYLTSSARGLSGRSGFQLVAASQGRPRDADEFVSGHMRYEPPASTLLLDVADRERLPVAFTYTRTGADTILTRCRSSGRDYAGRPGNYFGHGVLAQLSDIEGIRPIEFFEADWWADSADPLPEDRDLPILTALAPGRRIDPEAVLTWIHSRPPSQHVLLMRLVDAALRSLDEGTGRTLLVSNDPETIVFWLAAVSYSLPYEDAVALSFTTYSGNPRSAPYHLVGTTPTASLPSEGFRESFDLDIWTESSPSAPSRFASVVADSWRLGDFLQLDHVCEVVSAVVTAGRQGVDPGPSPRDVAAALSLVGQGHVLTRDVRRPAVRLLESAAHVMPPWLFGSLVSCCESDPELCLAGWRAMSRLGKVELANSLGFAVLAAMAAGSLPRARLLEAGVFSPQARGKATARLERLAISSGSGADFVDTLRAAANWQFRLDPTQVAGTARRLTAEEGADGVLQRCEHIPQTYAPAVRSGVLAALDEQAALLVPQIRVASQVTWLGEVDFRQHPSAALWLRIQACRRQGMNRAASSHEALKLREVVTRKDLLSALAHLWPSGSMAGPELRRFVRVASAVPDERLRAALVTFIVERIPRDVSSQEDHAGKRDLWNLARWDTQAASVQALMAGLTVYEVTQQCPLTLADPDLQRWRAAHEDHFHASLRQAFLRLSEASLAALFPVEGEGSPGPLQESLQAWLVTEARSSLDARVRLYKVERRARTEYRSVTYLQAFITSLPEEELTELRAAAGEKRKPPPSEDGRRGLLGNRKGPRRHRPERGM